MSMNLDLARCLSQITKIWFVWVGSLPLKQSKGFKARGGIAVHAHEFQLGCAALSIAKR